MQSKFFMLFAPAGLAIALSTGCQNTVNAIENADKHAAPTTIADRRYITDAFLRDRLVLRSVRVAPTPSGNLTVQVTATNVRTGVFAQAWTGLTDENPYNVDYKFTWQDENGMDVPNQTAIWQTRTIQPGETIYLQSTAPNARCKDFSLNLRESK